MAGTRSASAKKVAEDKAAEDALHIAVPLAHLALLALAVAPMFVAVETNLNILATATLAVYAGAHRSVRPVAGLTVE